MRISDVLNTIADAAIGNIEPKICFLSPGDYVDIIERMPPYARVYTSYEGFGGILFGSTAICPNCYLKGKQIMVCTPQEWHDPRRNFIREIE